MASLKRSLLVVFLVVFAPVGASQTDAERVERAVESAIGADFWGAIYVERDEEPVFARGYGLADLDSRPNTIDTYFDIGSVAKQFTAAAILKLEAQRKLKTSDSIEKHLDDVPADKRSITIQQLLAHTSGLPKESSGGGSRQQVVKRILGFELGSRPGERHLYSNLNYILLAAIVEEASGKGFESYLAKEIFKPAKLKDTGFVQGAGFDSKRDSQRVYEWRGETVSSSTATYFAWGWGFKGTTGVVTTVHDLARWSRALQGKKVLKADAKAKLFAPGLGDYACGWYVKTTDRGTRKAYHGGATNGYSAWLTIYLDEDVVIALASNEAADLPTLERAIVRALFPDSEPVETRPVSASATKSTPFHANMHVGELELEAGRIRVDRVSAWTVPVPKQGAERIWCYVNDPEDRAPMWLVGLYLSPDPAAELRNDLLQALEESTYDSTRTGQSILLDASAYEPRRGWVTIQNERLELQVRPNDYGDFGLTLFDPEQDAYPITALMSRAVASRLAADLEEALKRLE